MKQRGWPDINGWFVIGAILATLRAFWGKNLSPKTQALSPKGKILPFTGGSILEQGQKQAGELGAKVTTDGQRVDGEVSVSAQGQSWAAKLWAKVTAQKQAKPDVSAGIDVVKKW